MYKIYKWSKTPPAAGHFTIYSSEGRGNSRLNILQDLTYFPRMFREEKTLWIASWIFHLSIFFTAISHYKVFFPYMNGFERLNLSAGTFNLISNFLDGGASLLMIITLGFLLARRLVPFVRKLSEPEDYLVLLLVLGIAISGAMTRYSTSINLLSMRRYFYSLATFSPSNIPTDPIFLVHYSLVLILMIYFPFGKLSHIIGSALTSRLVRVDKT